MEEAEKKTRAGRKRRNIDEGEIERRRETGIRRKTKAGNGEGRD